MLVVMGRLTGKSHRLQLVGLTGVAMQLALGHGGGLAQVEERAPTTHRRLLGFNWRPFPRN